MNESTPIAGIPAWKWAVAIAVPVLVPVLFFILSGALIAFNGYNFLHWME